MKFLSVALIAALAFATVAVAAPPTTPNFSLKDLAWSSPVAGAFKKYFGNVKCIRDVVSEVMERNHLQDLYANSKAKFDKIVDVEWKKCMDLKESFDKEACKVKQIQEGIQVLTEVVTTLFSESKLDIINQLRKEITAKCLSTDDDSFYAGELAENPSFVEQFQCLVDVLADVSKSNGFEDLWGKTEPELQRHVTNWKDCATLENKFARFICNVKEGVQSYKIINEYLQSIASQNPQIIPTFVSEYRRQCSGAASEAIVDFFEDVNGGAETFKGAEHLECISDAITAAVHETDFASVWEGYKKDLEAALERINACKQEENKWEAAKCASKEIYNSYDILTRFAENLKKANLETYKRIRQYIKERCFK